LDRIAAMKIFIAALDVVAVNGDIRRADRARQPDQGRHQLRDQGAGDRICGQGHPRERGLARHHQGADACPGDPRLPRR
jgi:hypothetical protein